MNRNEMARGVNAGRTNENPIASKTLSTSDTCFKAMALDYAARGWAVLPLHSVDHGRCSCGGRPGCKPGKHPRTIHGVDDATTEPLVIERWWSRWPDANGAVATGGASGIEVIDIDPRNGGDKTILSLQREYGVLPATVEAATGGGGFHLLYRRVGVRVVGKLGPGVEVKSDGGYIVVAPSIHASGHRYRWQSGRGPGEIELEVLPERWRRLILRDKPERTVGSLPAGSRDGEAVPLELVKHCLAVLRGDRCDDYDSWIHVGLILKRTPTSAG